MKELLTIKNIVFLIGAFYLITVIERTLLKESTQTELILQHKQEKMQMQEDLNELNTKIYKYEIEILKNNSNIDSFSNEQLDSIFTTLF